MSSELKDKVVLITGGTSGIGEVTALALAKAGAHVVLTGRREQEGQAVAEKVRKHGVTGLFIKGDVTDERHLEDAVGRAFALKGRLDGAFNNAGVELIGVATADATAEAYRKVFDINVLGVLLSMKHQIRAMLKNPSGVVGSIVNTSSVAGSIGMGTAGIYVASKHAVNGLTKSAALEVAKSNIRINAVSPAAIETPMFDRFTGGQAQAQQYMAGLHPVGRVGKPEEIASAVLFLLGNGSTFVTGSDLLVDGGFTAQ